MALKREDMLREATALVRDLVDTPASKTGFLGDLRVRQALGVEVLNHAATQPSQLGYLLLRGIETFRRNTQQLERVFDRGNAFHVARRHRSPLDHCLRV